MANSVSLQAQSSSDADKLFSETSKDLIIVTAWASTGALLGLSTLSFLDNPWDHSKNILVGFSIGTVIGVGFVAFFHAGRSGSYYDGVDQSRHNSGPSKSFNTISRANWHNENFKIHNTLRAENIPLWQARF